MRIIILLSLAILPGPVSLTLLAAESGTSSARLAFTASSQGEFQFDTGILRGKLRPAGKALGLSSVVHIPSGLMLDRGDKGYGVFSHYRVFSARKRYGTAAWDWKGSAQLLADGAVDVIWPATDERPFEMRALYRWIDPATLDLETMIEPRQVLPQVEVFLASYFQEGFTNARVYVSDHPKGAGKPGFCAADKALGEWQMYPNDDAALALIKDGRWQLPPNPVNWTIMPSLASPIALRRESKTGLTAILMSPPEDCFAIALPHQTEGHYSLYLSLGGMDIKPGQRVRLRSRLWVAMNPTDREIVEQYQAYKTSARSRPNELIVDG